MAKPKPLVQVATLCESVLAEADRVVSVIRVIDTVYLTKPDDLKPPEGAEFAVQLRAFISLKSGDVKGEYDIELVLRSPSGKKAPSPQKWHVSFLGGQAGATLTIHFGMPVTELGLYWYDVIWEGEVLTSIPIMLVEGSKPGQGQGAAKQTTALG
jgi:hypothetical protein